MARAIDGDELLGIERLLDTDVIRKSKTASWLLDQVLHDIQAMPTLTPPNEGAKDKNVPTNDPLTLEELKAEAKRQRYKLIKDENIRFEPCLCGGTRREWWSGPEGVKVVCLRCGLESPWVPRSKGKNGVKKVWNAMILKNRKEQSNG